MKEKEHKLEVCGKVGEIWKEMGEGKNIIKIYRMKAFLISKIKVKKWQSYISFGKVLALQV